MPKSAKIVGGVLFIRIPVSDVEGLQSATHVAPFLDGNGEARHVSISARQAEIKPDDWRVDAMWGVVGPVVQIVKSWKLLMGVVVLLLSVNFEKLARFSDALKELIQ
jgi:hypothetical protein